MHSLHNVEAEDITRQTNINVEAGGTKTVNVSACVVDGQLNLKFLGSSTATSDSDASTQTVYVSNVKVTRLATNSSASKPTIFIASDSTVQTYESNYYPQTGWGQTLAQFFGNDMKEYECEGCNFSQAQTYETENVVVENRAIGGRSSKSYVEEGKLDDLLEDVKPGDYLLVQWGHNDATSSRPNRYVSSGDFRKWLMYYINGAKQRGATPVLVTPVARYSYTTNEDGTLKSFASNFEAYRQVMLKVADEENIPLVDLTQRSIDVCNSFGIEGAKSLFLWVAAGEYTGAYAGGASDSTHLQYYGAYKFAQCVAQGILEYDKTDALDGLKKYVVSKTAESLPEKIQNLTLVSAGATSVTISWDSEDTAELYYIYRTVLEDGQSIDDVDFSNAEKYSVSASRKYTDSSCEAGVTYVYAVGGFNEKGVGELSDKIQVSTKTAGYKFDINYKGSPTMDGWTGVEYDQAYSAESGYGWLTLPGNGRCRSNNGNTDSSDMADDFSLGAGEFAVDLPNGDYEVTVYACDLLPGTSTIKPAYTAEGVSLGSISTKQALGSCTNTVRVTDGQLNLVVGGTNMYLNGFTITSLLESPSGLTATEASVNGSNYTFLIGFNPVSDAAGYKIYQKGTSDKKFVEVKDFTAAEYKESELDCRAMSVDLGETYQYYMTCYTADGTESAPSETISVKAVLDGVKAPSAPKNLKCTDPASNATELQHTITLEWEASTVEDSKYPVIKYLIYRSDKAEDDKGFKGYEKIGQSTTTKFTDTDEEISTNIHYYYKVCALNAGGAGELSDSCETPIVGSLVRGGRESYSDRALVAINLAGESGAETLVSATDKDGNKLTKGVYLSWRSFDADFDSNNNLKTTFDVYCNNNKIASGISVTNMVYEGGSASDTFKVVGSNDSSIGVSAVSTKCWDKQYLELNLYCPEDETMPDGSTCSYTANDMSVGDLDGDGVLELIVKWYPSNAKDNSGSGYTGKTFLDGYDINYATGKVSLLWRIDMGVNIRSGAHYTQFQVWDYDCDGKAEIAVKTADGTTVYTSEDGTAATLTESDHVGACPASELPVNIISNKNDYRNSSGYILDGPEYFTMFNGEDGSIIDTVDYTPARGKVGAWGDAYGNRVDRFLSATAYLDGQTPFAVFTRGYYTRTCLTAYYLKDTDGDGVGDEIAEYWAFDTNDAGSEYEAQGNHGLSVNDIDNDGKDEIIYGSLTIDHDGTVKYSTGMGHGDAMHVSDWVSWNDGLEVMAVHEHDDAKYHVEIHDAETGEVLMGYYTGKDTGRGVAADIDPTAEGAEFWSIASPTYESNDEPAWDSTDGEVYSTWSTLDNFIKLADSTPASNFSIFWDGDLLSEIQDHTFNKEAYAPTGVTIAKWNYEEETQERLLYSTEIYSSNGTKGNLGLVADILGDWREEIIARCASDNNKVRIYTTTIQTDYVVPCLLENLAYREGVAWQNVGYNQPANLNYLLSEGLVTAKLSEGKVTSSSVDVNFTAANDGAYGHDIEGYEIYRADENGKYKLLDTLELDDLKKADGSSTADDEEEEEPVYLKFDFGAGNVAEGWTQVLADTKYSKSLGYGFTDTSINDNKSYSAFTDEDELADVYNDCVLGWKANTSVEFDVDVPNGTYEVTYYIYNGSGNVYNKVTAEDVEFADVRRGNSDKQATYETKTVEVTDGVLNIVNTPSKNGYPGNYFTGLTIKDVNYDEWAAAQDKNDGENTEDTTDVTYVYTDKTVDAGKTYSYKIAAIVDGKTSFMSRALEVETAVAIASVGKLDDVTIVEGTPLEDGQTAASLLPATVTVKTLEGDEIQADITWDVTELDINKTGTYTVYGTIKGYEDALTIKVTVAANEVIGYAAIEDITSVVGVEVTLPETVSVTYTNTTKEQKKVTWDTSKLDITKIADYTVKGTVEGTEDEVQVVVHIVNTYITSVPTTYAEVVYQSTDVAAQLPVTVEAIYADKKTGNSVVTWNAKEAAAIDTETIGTYKITGTIDGFDEAVEAEITVAYKITAAFDFGIKDATAADGYTIITVNGKGGTKTAEQLGINYTEEKGYGFMDATASIQGREEDYTQAGVLPKAVYTDFAIPDGQTFAVDVPNGTYQVDIVGGSAYKSTVKATIEGTGVSVSNAAGAYTVKSVEVTVTDGQLTCEFTSGATSRLDAIIVRTIKVDASDDDKKDDTNKDNDNKDDSKTDDNTGSGTTESGSTGSSDSSDNSSSSAGTTTVASNNWVAIPDQSTPLAETVTDGGLPYVNVQVDQKARLKAELLQKYYGHNLYLMTHLGNGIGYTIDASGIDDKADTLELGSALEAVPNFAEGFITFHFKPYHTQVLPYAIGIHMNVGAYNGQIAYLFSRDLITGEYVLSSITTVNEIGNVALQTNQMTDIMVLIAK